MKLKIRIRGIKNINNRILVIKIIMSLPKAWPFPLSAPRLSGEFIPFQPRHAWLFFSQNGNVGLISERFVYHERIPTADSEALHA